MVNPYVKEDAKENQIKIDPDTGKARIRIFVI